LAYEVIPWPAQREVPQNTWRPPADVRLAAENLAGFLVNARRLWNI
jgi:hypothetical protein